MRARVILAVMACAAILLPGCGGDDTASDGAPSGDTTADLLPCPVDALDGAKQPVEIVLWHSYIVRQATALQQIVDAYNASQDRVHITTEYQGSDIEALQKVQRALPQKDLPALMAMGDWTTQFMVDTGAVVPAQSCIEADPDGGARWDDLIPAVRAGYSVDDVLWPAAYGLSSTMLGYNRDHFRRANLDPDKPPRTLAEIRTAAEKIKAAGITDLPFVTKADPWKMEFWSTGAGETIVDQDNGHAGRATASTFDNPATREAMTWLSEMARDGLMKSESAADGNINDALAVATQSSSMLLTESSAMTTIAAIVEGSTDPADLELPGGAKIPPGLNLQLDLGAASFPGIEAPGRVQIGGSAWYMAGIVPDEQQAAAWDFLKYFNSPENQVIWLLEGSNLPAFKGIDEDPAVKEEFASGLAGKSLKVINDDLIALDPKFTGPIIGPYDDVRTAIRTAMEDTMLNGKDPTQAVKDADAAIDKLIQQYDDANF